MVDLLLSPFRLIWLVWRMIGTALFGLGTATVYRSLETLRWHRSTWWTFGRFQRPIDGVWLTGMGVLRGLEKHKHGIRRLIFPHPASDGLGVFEDATGQEYGLPRSIIQMTKRARGLDIEVGWYPGLVHVFFTVGKRWVHVEPHPPSSGDSKAPVYRLGLFNVWTRPFYRRAFDEMWRLSTDGAPLIDERFLGEQLSDERLGELIAEYRSRSRPELPSRTPAEEGT